MREAFAWSELRGGWEGGGNRGRTAEADPSILTRRELPASKGGRFFNDPDADPLRPLTARLTLPVATGRAVLTGGPFDGRPF